MKDSQPKAEGFGSMLRLAFPVILINLSMTLMQFFDALMVSVLGEKPLAASLPAGLVFYVPIAFLMGALGAVSAFVSQCLGRAEPTRCGHYAWQGMFLAVLSGTALFGLWWVAPGLFACFGHEPEVQALEVIYFRVSLFAGIPILITMALSNFFIGIHQTKLLAWFAVGATLLNIFFNWIFIFGRWGIPAMGLSGAALGTVLASAAQAVALLVAFMRPSLRRQFGTRVVRPEGKSIRELVRIGLPSGAQAGFDILSWGVGLIWMVGLFGTASLAATTIIVRCMHIGFMPPAALAAVLVAVVGKAIGEGNQELASREVRRAMQASLLYMATVAGIFLLFRHRILGVFTDLEEVIAIGASVMILVAVFLLFDGLNIIYSHALRGAGDTLWQALATALLCVVIFLGGGLVAVRFFPELGALGPWLTGTLYIMLLGCAMAWRWLRGPWRKIKIFMPEKNLGMD